MWELSIKHSTGKARLALHPRFLYEQLIKNDFHEVQITAAHGLFVASLEIIHKDPFDRILIAQATSEGMLLLTSDERVAQYDGPIRLVR
ncbi:type II toxin-antitoxin system VapC family toxin [Rhizobium terrae]|uniref:type II toxin-antitoxin system VapC family toxin n=1 Tax=Rhizobium terrae TaxID=2171756 RepID=UPI001D030990|nr:type II toxin-antitoxin system VapC family toxin [Rhizobium terrae]